MVQRPPRTKNFLHEEVEILVNVIEQRRQELDTSNRGRIKVPPKEMKKRWNQVAEDYCAVVHTMRSGSQCKKKWHDLGRVVSKKLAHNKREATRTGGGTPNLHPLTPLEQRVAAMMSRTWRKAICTAQAGTTRKEEEHDDDDDDANPKDPEDTEQRTSTTRCGRSRLDDGSDD
uniref:nuclear apoptosis-inducing factor 1-like n=1 Tax=Pristiophorus japonicus TaxID=55135 RepID=UPI00398E8596